MNLQIVSENIEITDSLKKIINKKITPELDKYLTDLSDDIKTATLTLRKETRWGYYINFDMWLPQKEHIYAETVNDTIFEAVTKLKTEITRQLDDYKGKSLQKRNKVNIKNVIPTEEVNE